MTYDTPKDFSCTGARICIDYPPDSTESGLWARPLIKIFGVFLKVLLPLYSPYTGIYSGKKNEQKMQTFGLVQFDGDKFDKVDVAES